ncbi:putative transporter [Pseudocercospora fuligena]|uniref:Putative transporter n=1 Tax=Pseudocercospora fuligena TaxID=685502 RepID=A0A8H6VFL6_9PEZI|nr:putative transporter [Pseudocercospora fuligena]
MHPVEMEPVEKLKSNPEHVVEEINASGKTSGDTHISDLPQLNRDEVAIEEPESQDVVRARRKVDMSVLLLLVLGLPVFQLDRMNLASALTGGFAKDIEVDQNTINLGNQLMFMGIVLLEIPANMMLQRLGPRIWISAQVCLFGLIATLQVFVNNRIGFLMARLMLGFAEAGYIPGAAYTLSNWYTRRELAKRVSIFFFGMFGGNAISPLLASGILELDGQRGLRGWQWLFMLEGLFTIFIAAIMVVCLPGSPDVPNPLIGPGYMRFSACDRAALRARLEKDDPNRRFSEAIDLRLVWKTVSHWRRWPHFVSTFAVFSTWSPLITYTPSIIMSLGFKQIAANALAAVGASMALLVVFVFGYISDRTNRRGGSVIAAQTCYLVVLVVARQVHPHVGRWSRWGLWTAVNSFAVGYHPVHNSWVQLNCHEARERSISIAMWVMSAISGLMVGTQYFRADDGPFYHNGLRTMIIMVMVGIVAAVLQLTIYVRANRQARRVEPNLGLSFLSIR